MKFYITIVKHIENIAHHYYPPSPTLQPYLSTCGGDKKHSKMVGN